ncbi:MAG: hypothetical protein HQL78_11845 [Magnetococcales bacterium]|nr:hypothetical protein [Magnetococcales bacterium]
MSTVSANIQVNFASFAADTPFELVVDDTEQEGSSPVQLVLPASLVDKLYVKTWGVATWKVVPNHIIGKPENNAWAPLKKMEAPGQKRVKVFCSLADAGTIQIIVDNGPKNIEYSKWEVQWRDTYNSTFKPSSFDPHWSGQYQFLPEWVEKKTKSTVNTAVCIGRRYDQITEALTWSGEVRKRLRYNYDNPAVEIYQKTLFRNRRGEIVPDPVYDPDKGEFFTTCEAIGALVVRYSPGYSVFNILYGIDECDWKERRLRTTII